MENKHQDNALQESDIPSLQDVEHKWIKLKGWDQIEISREAKAYSTWVTAFLWDSDNSNLVCLLNGDDQYVYYNVEEETARHILGMAYNPQEFSSDFGTAFNYHVVRQYDEDRVNDL